MTRTGTNTTLRMPAKLRCASPNGLQRISVYRDRLSKSNATSGRGVPSMTFEDGGCDPCGRCLSGDTGGAHFATWPPQLVRRMILAGCPSGGIVLDPFLGSGTTAAVAEELGCVGIGIDLNGDYLQLAAHRLLEARTKRRRQTVECPQV